jgi:hypothetical protein
MYEWEGEAAVVAVVADDPLLDAVDVEAAEVEAAEVEVEVKIHSVKGIT